MKFNELYTEEKVRLDPKCWTGKKIGSPKTKLKGGVRVNNCVPAESVEETANPAQQAAIAIAKKKESDVAEAAKHGLYYNVNKRKKAGTSRPANSANAPTAQAWKDAAKTAKTESVAEGKDDKIAQLKKDYATAVHWSKNDTNPHKREAARQKAEKIKRHLDTQYKQGVAEDYNAEYDDESGMAYGSLLTAKRAVDGLMDTIDPGDNLPEWCQEKISLAEDYLVTVWDYIQSEKQQGMDPEIEEMYEAIEDLAEEMAAKNGVSADLVWETFEAMPDNMLYETAAWRRKEGKSKKGGLNAKGVASYRRENPGSKLQTAVTTKPSKLKAGSKSAKRRKSFCARMSGVKGPAKKPNGKPTRKALALRKWNC